MEKRLTAEHGTACRLAGERFGYFGWPSAARLENGALLVVSSGLRSEHICPWGRTVLNASEDGGTSWSAPRVIHDSPIDDRDAGILHLGGGRLLVTWFTSDTRAYAQEEWVREWLGEDELADWQNELAKWTDETVNQWLGSWTIESEDGGVTWGKPARAPVSAPHGPALLSGGSLLYLGKDSAQMSEGFILAARSGDGGKTWETLGSVPLLPGTMPGNYHEPHAAEMPDGRLVGLIRMENAPGSSLEAAGLVHFSMVQTESTDQGRTWSMPRPLGFHGSPPHLLLHSSGALVCVYGHRLPGYGQRAMISYDQGASWDQDWIIRDDGPDGDLGYPASVEMDDGSIFTAYYQKVPGDRKCSLLWSRWQLPQAGP